jgi:MFS family permease
VWHVGVAAIFLGMVTAFALPARQAFLAEVVGKADITNAIALNSAAFNGARIIGPVTAGFIISSIGIPACFYLNAVSFVPVIFALSKIKSKGTIKADENNIWRDIADGWRFIISGRPVLYIMAMISVFSLFGIPYITLLPMLAGEILHVGAKGFSFLVALAGTGSFIAAMMIAFKGEIRRKDIYITLSAVVFSLAILGISLSKNFYVSMLFSFVAGWGVVSFLAMSNSFIQHRVPDYLRGRVMSLYTLVFLGFAPVGNSIIGLMAHSLGTIASLKIFAVLCIVGSIIFSRKFKMGN